MFDENHTKHIQDVSCLFVCFHLEALMCLQNISYMLTTIIQEERQG